MKFLLTSNRIQLVFQFLFIIALLASECFGSINENGTTAGTSKLVEKSPTENHLTFRILTEEFPPYNFTDNEKISGISTEIVREILKKVNHPDKLEVLPWMQGYNLLQEENNIILFSTTRSPMREDLFKWVGPLVPNNTVFFAKKGSGISISSMDDARKVKSIGVYKDDFGELLLKKKGFNNLNSELDNKLNVKKLAEGKIDLWIINELTGKHMARKVGLEDKIEKVYAVQKDYMYIAFSKSTPDTVIKEWQNVLDTIKADGTYAQIFSKWIMFSYSKDLKPRIKLSEKEKIWLDEHQVIRFGVDPAWPPFDFVDDKGKHQGIAADILKLLGERLGITLERQQGLSWEQVLTGAREHTLDLISICSMTLDRSKYLAFTNSFATQSYVIATRKQFRHVESLKDIIDDKVAMANGYAVVELVQNQFPDLPIQLVETPLAGLSAVATGRVDAYVGDLGVISYLIQEKNLGNLKVAGDSGLGFQTNFHLATGVRSDWPELVTILNKGLDSISQEDMKSIRQKWIPVELEHAKAKKSTLTSLWQLIAGSVVIFIALFFLIRYLMKYSKEDAIVLQYGSRRFRMLTIITLSFIVTAISFSSWFAMKHNKKEVLYDIQTNLETILKSTSERLDNWVNHQKNFIEQLGRNQELVAITEHLLAESLDSNVLKTSSTQSEAREFFDRKRDQLGEIEFFIINPEYISIASKFDSNIGHRNFIAIQRPDLIKKAFQGEAMFIPPIFPDVNSDNFPHKKIDKNTPAMFFVSPVQKADGETIAVIARSMDPADEFSKIMQFSRLGETGESYAFDRNGRLLSKSRFKDHLIQIGLLKPDQSSILNVEIRDPGGNMVEGYQSSVPRSKQPLTLMASRAIKGLSGIRTEISPGDYNKIEINMQGYRDYRGVSVFGAWLWENHLDAGLTVEIDVEDALSTYHTIRLTITIILGVTLFLFVGTTLFTLVSGESTNRTLIKARDKLEERVKERTSELGEKKKEVEDKSALIEAVLHSISQGLVAYDKQLRLIICNQRFREIRDVPAELTQPGSSFEDLMRFDLKRGEFGTEYSEEALRKLVDIAKQFIKHSFERVRDNGTVIEVFGGPLPNGGFVSTFDDITDRRKMEKQLQEAYQIIKSQNERMEGELSVGHEIQMSMLPLVFPPFPDRKEFEIYADLQPAREVGGDLYDFFFINDEQLCFCVGDVSGKGVPAALFMAVTKTLIKSSSSNDTSPASILTQANEELSQNNNSCMFVTVFIGILNTKTGEMVYSNAGHNPPYIKRNNNSIECMDNRHGPVIGAVGGIAYKEDKAILKKGDVLLLFTDGVTEAMDPDKNLFSETRLTGLLSSRKFASVEDIVNTTIKEVKLFAGDAEQSDDITILAIEFHGQTSGISAQNLTITIRNNVSEIDKVNQRFNTFAEHCGIPKTLCQKVNIVFDELLNNIISYAYKDNIEHEIIIELEFLVDRLSLTIKDDGVPFNPLEAKKPDTELSLEDREIGGLGIHLVCKLMDKVSYKRHIDRNVISVTKQIKG
ncbi:MAG: transporter substrate-binding domain-containing protein [Candidatus Scalindua sp.]|jgi:serine phosphatase RsbU (regulator of sigma subunit)/ABC-type amino acid transport substrate-binding protein/anti-sigma regulatory factor (Ser/Thr protein kinase)|nr:transporter substrate-binding domain-containing protein [Candidatus Scalindua sp.]MBT5304745.1 transporter substrate-binding domain-containing protein [Candidatus Scalindua sp.]MBT6562494.1 transporter substrate-binding domain-containing protein [Candidatus Scalindua sp.]MBT7210462.1 transporter substrate-binding domain-containing protein [Candidatus Scalindua sp.]MBT7592314.1 transporter substrate-binding domain-containing protein [Candidatus Scalindua sp.]